MTSDVIDLSARLAASLAEREPNCGLVPPPAPGVYEHVPFETYMRWHAVSNTWLSKLSRSPAHLRAYLDGEPEDTATLILGRAFHCAALEPIEFDDRYVSASAANDKRTKAGKAEWDLLVERFGEGRVLKAEPYQACVAMRASVRQHRSAGALLASDGPCELSIVWVDQETGLTCKARLDKHLPSVARGTVLDLKSSVDASKRAFERSILTYGYHRQAAHYLTGAQACGLEASHFMPIAVEKEPPYAVGAYRLMDSVVDAGDGEVRQLLRLYQRCVERNDWPAYSEQVEDVAIPDYGWKQIDDHQQLIGTNYEVEP